VVVVVEGGGMGVVFFGSGEDELLAFERFDGIAIHVFHEIVGDHYAVILINRNQKAIECSMKGRTKRNAVG